MRLYLLRKSIRRDCARRLSIGSAESGIEALSKESTYHVRTVPGKLSEPLVQAVGNGSSTAVIQPAYPGRPVPNGLASEKVAGD
jgi:hypothetical protein